jgi:glycyl-tRNA synthetase beta chain
MSMSRRDFLVEIGSEELPPKSLFVLLDSFANGIVKALDAANIAHGEVKTYATPRRLAVHIAAVADQQPDVEIKRQGPAVANAFDASGAPTRAALGFAASCGVAIEQLEQADGPKGRVLQYVGTKTGEATLTLLPAMVATSLDNLPIAKRMRWGAGEQEFVRPVHWVVMLLGSAVVEADILGIHAGKQSRGHRFHAPQPLTIASPAKYASTLREKGYVMADVNERRELIRSGVIAAAQAVNGEAVIDAALLDEVTALVEWPVPVTGSFDARFLDLPAEVPIATMQDHQRYFPVRDAAGKLMNHFITIANIESRDPSKVRDGNERVVRPRLSDAAFFWDMDRKQKLETRCDSLKTVTFQTRLGSVYDKSVRVSNLAGRIAELIGGDVSLAKRAALLAKCDLITLMVGEFPELQGVMGRYYAERDGEPTEVCSAIEEHYWPRFAGDRLPQTRAGIAVSIADKLDTIAGIFAIGQKPSGAKDPFALRRLALGILRINLEHSLELDLLRLVEAAVSAQPVVATAEVVPEIWSYLMERLRGLYLDREGSAITTEMFDAVIATQPHSVTDIDGRLRALQSFLALPDATGLAVANKRISNILRKVAADTSGAVDTAKFREPAERQLFEHVISMERAVNPLFARRDYAPALSHLAGLREDVDRFFESVMVMAEEADVQANRLALLVRLRALFLHVADLSRLPG